MVHTKYILPPSQIEIPAFIFGGVIKITRRHSIYILFFPIDYVDISVFLTKRKSQSALRRSNHKVEILSKEIKNL